MLYTKSCKDDESSVVGVAVGSCKLTRSMKHMRRRQLVPTYNASTPFKRLESHKNSSTVRVGVGVPSCFDCHHCQTDIIYHDSLYNIPALCDLRVNNAWHNQQDESNNRVRDGPKSTYFAKLLITGFKRDNVDAGCKPSSQARLS